MGSCCYGAFLLERFCSDVPSGRENPGGLAVEGGTELTPATFLTKHPIMGHDEEEEDTASVVRLAPQTQLLCHRHPHIRTRSVSVVLLPRRVCLFYGRPP